MTNTTHSKPKPKSKSIFHPDSRKAAQLARTSLQKSKRAQAATQRAQKHASQADVYGFFYHALPPEGVLTLDALHTLVRDVWLGRHDHALAQARGARRKGRPKSTQQLELEDEALREAEAYRTGIEVPDLTHAPTVERFRQWDLKEVAYVQQLRFIRISSADPTRAVVVSKPGTHDVVQRPDQSMSVDGDDDNIMHSEPLSRFASTMTTMDGPL